MVAFQTSRLFSAIITGVAVQTQLASAGFLVQTQNPLLLGDIVQRFNQDGSSPVDFADNRDNPSDKISHLT